MCFIIIMKTLLDYCRREYLANDEIQEAISLIPTSDLNEKDMFGQTALLYTAYRNHKEIVFFMV